MKKILLAVACCLLALPTLANITITDSNGILTFEQVPKRVVVINWTLAEQVTALGIEPVGVADLAGYQQQVVEPALPENVVDVGSRLSPNLIKIKQLQPDVIIVGYSQKSLIRVLSNIAPVVYFKNFSRRYHNANKADERLLELAKLFDRTSEANKLINQRQQIISGLRQQLEDHYGDQKPKVTLMVIDADDHAWTFGENAMADYALHALGLEPGWQQKPSQYGAEKTKAKDLAELTGCVLYVSYQQFKPLQHDTWRQLPAVENQCFLPMPPAAFYGGSLSLQYLAKNITKTLLTSHQP